MIPHSSISLLLIAVGSISIIPSAVSLRILGIFLHPGASHFHFIHPIVRGLADIGHDVTVISHFPDKNPPANYTDLPLTGLDVMINAVNLEQVARHSLFYLPEFFMLHDWALNACNNALNSSALKKVLSSKKRYDVILIEQFSNDCMMGIAWKLKAPVIGLTSCVLLPWHYDRVAYPMITSYVPSLYAGSSDRMTFGERLHNWLSVNIPKQLYKHFIEKDTDAMVRKYLKDDSMPFIGDLVQETSLMLVNSHYSIDGPKPHPPNVIEVGGVHIKVAKPLDKELKKFLDSATDGVIYVSWGSMIRAATLPTDKRTSLLKAFSSFKQKVLWKWENTTLPNQPENVFIRQWMPQQEILCHPNVRVFVSHGGLLGLNEAAYCGVTMVLTPMYGDQFHNSAAARHRGMGEIVHYEDISETTMKNAIEKALNPIAQENAKKVSYSYRNRPKAPLELAIWWIEHVAATQGAPLIKSYPRYLPAYIYHSLDIYAAIAAIILGSLASWLYVLRKCFSKLGAAKKKIE